MVAKGRDFHEKRIEHSLSIMAAKLKAENGFGKAAYNKTVETTMCGLLNRMYRYKFKNQNTAGRPNFPGIDLISEDQQVGVQITTDNSTKKVDEAIKMVREHEECSSIRRLILLMPTFEKPTRTMKERKADRWFNGAEDIWNLHKILADLQNDISDATKLEEIADYLEKEIGGAVASPPPKRDRKPARKNHSPTPICAWRGLIRNRRLTVALAVLLIIAAIWGISSAPRRSRISSPESAELLMWNQVQESLQNHLLAETAIPLSIYEADLRCGTKAHSFKTHSVSYPFTVQSKKLAANPISAFDAIRTDLLIPDEDTFGLREGSYGILQDYLYKVNDRHAGTWEWSVSGVTAFLDDMLTAAAKCDDEFDLDDQLLSSLHNNPETAVHFSAKDQCYYVYFIYYGDCSSHIVCMYFHADQENGTQIADVEVQFLNMRYCGFKVPDASLRMQRMENACRAQMLSIIMSIEQLMTGDSGLNRYADGWDLLDEEVVIPEKYTLGDYSITTTMSSYRSDEFYEMNEELGGYADKCELITYRIRSSDS